MVRTICPSLPMRIKALGVNAAPAAPSALRIEGRVVKPMRSPPPSAALALRNCRRERSTVMSGPFLAVRRTMRRVLDSLADSHIRAAAADVSRHGIVYVCVAGAGILREQRRSRHDLAGLAIAALRYLQIDPGLLNLLAGRRPADGLDRDDLLSGHRRYGRDAGTGRSAVDVHGAGAAKRGAAAEFRAGHSQHVAKNPEQRRVVVDIDAASSAVDCQRMRHLSLLIMGLPSVGLAWGNVSMSSSAASLPPTRTAASFMVLRARNPDDGVLMRRLPSMVFHVSR